MGKSNHQQAEPGYPHKVWHAHGALWIFALIYILCIIFNLLSLTVFDRSGCTKCFKYISFCDVCLPVVPLHLWNGDWHDGLTGNFDSSTCPLPGTQAFRIKLPDALSIFKPSRTSSNGLLSKLAKDNYSGCWLRGSKVFSLVCASAWQAWVCLPSWQNAIVALWRAAWISEYLKCAVLNVGQCWTSLSGTSHLTANGKKGRWEAAITRILKILKECEPPRPCTPTRHQLV